MEPEIVLGSSSPRRREILEYFSIPFIQASPDIDEEALPWDGDGAKHAETLAFLKGEELKEQFPNSVIITADTIVSYKGISYAKPADADEALEMLQTLGGNWHEVYTGVSVRKGEESWTESELTRVLLNKMDPYQIMAYQRRCHSIDKAGGYTAHREGSIIVNRLEGCFYNVMGLPVNTLHKLLIQVGVDLWDYIS